MNDQIITDGVSRITSGFTGGYGNQYANGFLNGEGFGYGRGFDNGSTMESIKTTDTSNSWREDNHGAERTAETIEAIHGSEVATEKTGAANSIAIEKTGAAALLATEKTAAATQLSNALSFSDTKNLLISGFKDGRYDAAVNAAATALAAATNTAAILAAQAECCCELKEKIGDDGQKTRDLINSIQSTNLAVELADVKNQLVTTSAAAHAAEQTGLINAIINAFSTGILPTALKKTV